MILRPENYLSQYAGKVYKGDPSTYIKQYLNLLDDELRCNQIKRVVFLVSGGFDSFAALRLLRHTDWYSTSTIIALRLDLGQEYNDMERSCFEKLVSSLELPHVETLSLPILHSKYLQSRHSLKMAGIPARNLALASIAAMYEPDAIMMANVADDNYYDAIADCTHEFRTKMSDICSLVLGKKVEVFSPVQLLTKSDLMAMTVPGLGWTTLMQTKSCYHPTEWACGECQACFRRMVACINSNTRDHFRYIKNPMDNPQYRESFLFGRKPALTVQEVQDAFYQYANRGTPCLISPTSLS